MSKIYYDFKDFLLDNNIIITIIATVLSSNITMITKSLMDNIIMPLYNIDLNNDGISDRTNLENFIITYYGTEFKIGKFILTLIEFFIILFILYIINKFSKK